MANVIYEKTSRLPPVGSLREALILTVWLRREEREVFKTKALIAASLASQIDDLKPTIEAFKDYFSAVFPYTKSEQSHTDEEMVTTMKKEVSKGPIKFSVANAPNPLTDTAKRLSMPDEFKKKLQDRVRTQRKK